tara:strand:- start:3055 stop:3255 length:201 start_codon:yes stop_codon:yes gene_type:complete
MIQKAASFPIGTIKKIKGKKKIVKLVQIKGKQPYHKWVNMTKDVVKVNYNVKKGNKLVSTIKKFIK